MSRLLVELAVHTGIPIDVWAQEDYRTLATAVAVLSETGGRASPRAQREDLMRMSG